MLTIQNIIEIIKNYQLPPNLLKKAPKQCQYSMKSFLDMPKLSQLELLKLSQSDSIRGGIIYEYILNHLVKSDQDCKLLDTLPSLKKVKQKDLLFYNKNENTVYYFEVKTNINIDSEKRRATAAKINNITLNNFKQDQKYLKEEYNISLSNYDQIVSRLLCPTKLDYIIEWLIPDDVSIYGLPMFLTILTSKDLSDKDIEQTASAIREKIKSRLNLI